MYNAKEIIALFKQESELKEKLVQVKELADQYRRELADSKGEGRHKLAGHVVEIKVNSRNNTSWKDVAFSLAPEDAVNKAKAQFTSNSEVITVKLVDEE